MSGGPCDCPNEGCGCFFDSTGDIIATGSGSETNPMRLQMAPGRLLEQSGESDGYPPDPAAGQLFYEHDTGILRMWNTAEWVVANSGLIHAAREQLPATPGLWYPSVDVNLVSLPAFNYRTEVQVDAACYVRFGDAGALWQLAILYALADQATAIAAGVWTQLASAAFLLGAPNLLGVEVRGQGVVPQYSIEVAANVPITFKTSLSVIYGNASVGLMGGTSTFLNAVSTAR